MVESARLTFGWFVLVHHHHEHQIFVVRIVVHQEQRQHDVRPHLGVGRLNRAILIQFITFFFILKIS